MIKNYIFGIAVVLVLLMLLGIFNGTITGNIVQDDKVVIYLPKSADFPNKEQGIVVFEFSFPQQCFFVADKEADFLMFLDSSTIPGLKIGYSIQEKKIYAGLPIMISEEVDLLNGQHHKLAFAISTAEGKQGIILDDKMIMESEFKPDSAASWPTGFAVLEMPTIIYRDLGIMSYAES